MSVYSVAAFDGTLGVAQATSIDAYTLPTSFTLQLLVWRNQPGVGYDTPFLWDVSGELEFFELGSVPAQSWEWDSNGLSVGTNPDGHWIFYTLIYDGVANMGSTISVDITDLSNSNNINLGAYTVTSTFGPISFGPFSYGTDIFRLALNTGGADFIGQIFGGAAYNTVHALDRNTQLADIGKIINTNLFPDTVILFNAVSGSAITEYKTGHNLTLASGVTFPTITVTNFTPITLLDFATATDSISISGNQVAVTLFDQAYAQDFISVARDV